MQLKVGDSITQKKRLSIILILITLLNTILLASSPNVKAGVIVSPAELHVEIKKDYPPYTPKTNIKVTNPYDFDIQAHAKAIKPWDLRKNYVVIPDLSWIDIYPETLDIPAHSSNFFNISIKIPENEKPHHYNESWEVWVWIVPNLPRNGIAGQVGIDFQVQYNVRILIKTPPSEINMKTSRDLYNFLIIFFIFIGIPILLFIAKKIKNKKIIEANKKANVFYLKKNGNYN
ncbi:MAG: hypothetical protein ACQXXD_06945 [Thermoplasmatota archaeon]|jgi:hypothetical protein